MLRALPFVAAMLEMMDSAEADRGWLADRSRDKLPLPREWKVLEFSNVGFTYENSEAGLSDINLCLERGRFYGVVGRSGSGKSTLINLLLGLYSPTCGRVFIDGIPRDEVRSTDWIDQLAYVPQDVFILDESVKANIAFGRDVDKSPGDMSMAIRISCLNELLADLPEGLDTQLGERGRRFSGGQAQRVAIARALYSMPSILLMDEATSALDSITEAHVQDGIRALGDDVLVIAVAHRISSLRKCDAIIVMDEGRIKDMGSYAELLEKSTLFAELASSSEKKEPVV
jgi:ABC-type multidrug transport system fused ATPase/permease subunit